MDPILVAPVIEPGAYGTAAINSDLGHRGSQCRGIAQQSSNVRILLFFSLYMTLHKFNMKKQEIVTEFCEIMHFMRCFCFYLFHALAILPLVKELPVSIVKETGWTPEPTPLGLKLQTLSHPSCRQLLC